MVAPQGPWPEPGPPERGRPVPWEDEAVGFPANLLRTWRDSLFQPAAFFAAVDLAGAFVRPLLYYLIVTIVSAAFAALWGLVGVGGETVAMLSAALGVRAEGLLLLGFFLSPFYGLAALAVSTLALHLFAALLVPDRAGVGATARVVCYAAGPSVLTVLPALGGLAGTIWSVVLVVAGLQRVHRTTVARAAAVALLPLALLVLLLLSLMVVLFVMGRFLPAMAP